MRAERATGAPKARRAERASAQAEHAGTRWSHRRSADNFTVQRSALTGHLVFVRNIFESTTTKVRVLSYESTNLLSYEGTFAVRVHVRVVPSKVDTKVVVIG